MKKWIRNLHSDDIKWMSDLGWVSILSGLVVAFILGFLEPIFGQVRPLALLAWVGIGFGVVLYLAFGVLIFQTRDFRSTRDAWKEAEANLERHLIQRLESEDLPRMRVAIEAGWLSPQRAARKLYTEGVENLILPLGPGGKQVKRRLRGYAAQAARQLDPEFKAPPAP